MKCRDRKTHVSWRHYHPEMFCTFRMIWKLSGWSGNFPDGLETFRMIWKLSGWFGNFRIIWNLSGWSENFPDGLETFQMAWKLSDDLESVWMIWKLFGGFDNFPDGMKTYLPISIHEFLQKRIYVNVAKTIDALFWCIRRENDLPAPSRKFCRAVEGSRQSSYKQWAPLFRFSDWLKILCFSLQVFWLVKNIIFLSSSPEWPAKIWSYFSVPVFWFDKISCSFA